MNESRLDLTRLERKRTNTQSPAPAKSRRAWISRYVVPGMILLGFLSLIGIATWDQFRPKQQVRVVPVVVTRAEVQQEGTPLFQAAGWIEPRPTAINVAALTEGVVEELYVVEGQEVAFGDPVAKLIDVDLKLALRDAQSNRELKKAELESARAELKAAKLRFENPVHIEAPLADARSLLAQTETSLGKMPFLIEAAEARVEYAKQNLAGKQSAQEAIAGRLIQEAKSAHAQAQAELRELKQRLPRLEREVDAIKQKVKALETQRQLLIDESRQVEDSTARVAASSAKLEQAELAIEKAQLAIDRTIVRAPATGRVLKLIAQPGTRVMGLESSASQSSSTVVSLYDPQMLQVRADVRLEDVPLVQPQQPVEIETASSQEPIRGVVLLPTSTANIQKNTLEVKVALIDPPATIRPEMLVTATFLAPPQEKKEQDESQEYERLLVPRKLVRGEGESRSVWIVDHEGIARLVPVRLGKAGTGELVEVIEGVRPTDKLISSGAENLEPGSSVTVAGEDPSIGIEPS